MAGYTEMVMKGKKIALFAGCAAFLLAIAPAASAQLVSCQNDCNLCDLLKLFQTLITWGMSLALVLVTGFVAWGGLEVMLSGASKENYGNGVKRIRTSIIGLIIMLCSWLIISTVLHIFTGSPNKIPWTKIQCPASLRSANL